jgi:DNA-binding MarR family transcriptional regulator/N-acetylglutamate synthase-like GNAT family acetyltransferase
MTIPNGSELAEVLRCFQGFYARHVAAPHEPFEHGRFSLTEMRVMYEVMRAGFCTAADIARNLGLDTGYLNRLLSQFERSGLLARRRSVTDRRRCLISLTRAGENALNPAGDMRQAVTEVLDALAPVERLQLVESLGQIKRLLAPREANAKIRLRGARAGDFGWIVQRQVQLATGALVTQREREARVARAVTEFLEAPEPLRNACWIAEQDGVSVGAIALMGASSDAAQIAAFFVEPGACGIGIGARLIGACVQFAAVSGYEALICSPHEESDALVRLLARSGFEEMNGRSNWCRILQRSKVPLHS